MESMSKMSCGNLNVTLPLFPRVAGSGSPKGQCNENIRQGHAQLSVHLGHSTKKKRKKISGDISITM